MREKKGFISLCFAVGMLFVASGAFAHNLWLNPDNHFPQVGETVGIGVGWGHTYPANRVDQEVKEDRVEEIRALDPEGKTVELQKESPALYKLKIEKPGVYLVAAKIKPGVFTMTPEGRKWATKKEVQNATKCTAFDISAKTVIVAGTGNAGLSSVTGQPLEVIPLESPATLKKGSAFPVRALFEGKPLAGFAVRAVYAGFASDVEGHGQGGGEKKFPVETLTDKDGLANLSLDRGGYWMINLSHKVPYPDAETCDESMYNSAFTFQVQ